MKIKSTLIFLCAGAALPDLAHSAQKSIQCPREIKVNEAIAAEYPPWQATPDKQRELSLLNSVQLYSGHPDDMGTLVPTKTVYIGRLEVSTWSQLDVEHARGYWLGCSYSNSKTLLSQRLPDGIKACVLKQKINQVGTHIGIESFACE